MSMPSSSNRWPQLTACFIALMIPSFASGQRRPMTMSFKLDQPFTFRMGDTATGADGLSIWFSGAGLDKDGKHPSPSFSFKRGEHSLDGPFWSGQSTVCGQPLMCGLLGGLSISVLKVEPQDPYATTLVISKYKPAQLKWQAPITIKQHEFVVDPDGTLWTFTAPDGDEGRPLIRLLAREKGSADQLTADLWPGEKGSFGPKAWGDLLLTARIARGTWQRPAAVRLVLSKPQETVKRLQLGRPLTLYPGESGRGPSGLMLTLGGYGHKIAMDHHDIPTVFVTVKQGSKEGTLVFFQSRGKKPAGRQEWEGWSITMQSCKDDGPPHSRTATSTFVVQKAR